MNTLPRLVFLIAAQRTGTNVFGRLLDDSGVFDHYGEVFDPNKIHGKFMSFFHYLNSDDTARDLYCLPNEANIRELFDRWLRDFLSMGTRPYALFDLKQNALHRFNALSQSPSEAPFLIRMAREKGIPIIRITRRNLFEQAVSWEVAVRSNTWHLPKEYKPSNGDVRFSLEKDALLRSLYALRDDNLQICRFLHDYPVSVELDYEDMYPDHIHLNPSVLDRLAVMLEDTRIRDIPTILPFAKTVPRASDHIVNIQDVIKWLQGTPFEEMLQTSLAR